MSDLWTHIGFARLAATLGLRAGLRFAPNRQPAAEAAALRVMAEVGERDPLAFARRVEQDPDTLAALLAEVTIGETYFFREPGQLAYIESHVLPTFRDRRSATRPLRAWSAGCASGEEPYTLAIMLRNGGWEGAARVLGTDISRPRLDAAERARYTDWSLRGVAEEVADRYFIRRGRQFLLRPEIRSLVELRPLNLAAADYPGAQSGIGAMDLILCRNVLIYFDRDTVTEVATRLLASLGDDGWLFLGASDPMLTDLVPCETVVTGAGLAYRPASAATRSGRRASSWPGQSWPASVPEASAAAWGPPPNSNMPPAAPATSTVPTPPGPDERTPAAAAAPTAVLGDASTDAAPPDLGPLALAQARYAARDYAAAAALAADAVALHPRDADAWTLLIRALANAGRGDEADQACVVALERCPAAASLAYLHAVLLTRRGQAAAAAAAARRAVYLDRSLAVAHLALGSALVRAGDATQARRAFRAAERLLDQLPPDAPVPLADGETARRLAEAARAQRLRLDGAGA